MPNSARQGVAQSRTYDGSIRSLSPKDASEPIRFALSTVVSAGAAVLFVLVGLAFIPLTGFQSDEVMFAYVLWHPEAALADLAIRHHILPSMMLSYLGAFKSWLYLPILNLFGDSLYAVRVPMLLLTAITTLLTGRLLRRVGDKTAAMIVVLLLCTDVVWLVTSVFDWGPVAVQNFLLVLGLLFALRWYDKRRDRDAFLTGLVYGLALWNKALFLWNLSGMVIALLVFALPAIRRAWRWKAFGWLAVGLLIGSYPLLRFNLQTRGATLTSTAKLTTSEIADKANYMSLAIDGRVAPSANVDFASPKPDRESPPSPHTFAAWMAATFGTTPSSWRFPFGFLVIVLGAAVATGGQRKWILFFVVSGLIGWLQSAMTPDAGRSIHHTVLFWIPWYGAITLGCGSIAAWRPPRSRNAVVGVVAFISLIGLVTIGVDYADLAGHSATTPWSDADVRLAAKLSSLGAHEALTTDWGIADVLSLRSHDQIAVEQQEFNLNSGNLDADRFAACKQPSCYVVTHVPERLIMAKASATLHSSFGQARFAPGPETTIRDSHGTPTFVVFPLTASSGGNAQPAAALPPAMVSNTPQLIATPAVLVSTGTTGRVTLTWQVPSNMLVEIHVGAPNGKLFASSLGPGQEQTGFWVMNGMQFFLQNVTGSKPLTAENTLAHVTVEVRPR